MAETTAEKKATLLDSLLTRLADLGGSDLFMIVGKEGVVWVGNKFEKVTPRPLTRADMERILDPIFSVGHRRAEFELKPDLDIAHFVPNKGRYRINVYRSKGELGMVARLLKLEILNCDQLGLPECIRNMALLHHGLVLVVGGTGSGKSTTLAAMIDHRNANMEGHIVTIEDPIEFYHAHKKCVVSQRELGNDTAEFHDAMKSALRQAPDLILIGEIRDAETAETALHMSETGHLVMATLHATNAAQTLERIANMFPESQRPQILMLLSLELGGIVAQRLVPKKGHKGRLGCQEIMMPTPLLRELVRKGDIDGIKQAMREAGGSDGMQTFEDVLTKYVMDDVMDFDDALVFADSPSDLKLRIRNELLSRQQQGLESPEIDFGSSGEDSAVHFV